MTRHEHVGVSHDRGPIEVKSPDYHLTAESPLWAATHYHSYAGPPALSVHAGMEVGVVVAGQEEVQLGDCAIPGNPGDVWLCAMSEPHRYRVLEPGTVNLVMIFLPSFLGDEMLGAKPWLTLFATPPTARPRVGGSEQRSKLLEIASELRREVEGRQEDWECAVRLGLLRLLFDVSRGWTYPGTADGGQAHMANLRRLMPALALLHESPSRPVSRPHAARACGLGPSRFTMLFRETMGASFQTFRRRMRLGYAAGLLLSTELTLEVVADRTGFSDASHLHRSFVQEYGCTPGEYRAQSRLPAARAPRKQVDPWAQPGSVSVEYVDPSAQVSMHPPEIKRGAA